jgi:putative ABC transport system permease protein
MEAITRQIRARHREDSQHGVLVQPLRDWMVRESRRPLLLLAAAVLLVLLIGCANIANLLLAKASAREREMSIRAGLGAGRARLVRQTLVESLLLAGLGGLGGVALAAPLMRMASALGPRLARSHELAADTAMLWVAAGLTLATGLLFGLAPAWHAGRPASASRWGNRLRGTLVVAQLSLALLLLSASGLVTNSLIRLLRLDLGFDRSGLLAIDVDLPNKRYDRAATTEFTRRLADDVSRMPGVLRVALSDYPPLLAVLFPIPLRSERTEIEAFARHVSPGYFETLHTPVLAGREFVTGDLTRKPIPVLINAATARVLFGVESPLGRTIRTPLYKDRREMEVIGVAGAARQLWLRDEPGYQVYFPVSYGRAGHLLVRVAPNAGPLTREVRAAAAAIDPAVLPEVSPLDDSYKRETAEPRFLVALFGSLTVLGLVLAVIGIYGVMAYAVARRTREFGVRMALGADPGKILRLVVGSGAQLTAVGVAVGLAAALALTRFLRALLYGVEPGDPWTLGGVALLLSLTAMLACWIAARRAAQIDAWAALRCE